MGRSQSFGKGHGCLEESNLSWHNPSAAAKPKGIQVPLGDASAAISRSQSVDNRLGRLEGPMLC